MSLAAVLLPVLHPAESKLLQFEHQVAFAASAARCSASSAEAATCSRAASNLS